MGVIGGDEWEVASLPITTVMQQLQTPTISPAAGASANANFRTGLATQLATGGFALAIHSIRWNLFPTFGAAWEDIAAVALQGQLTEALTATSVSLTEPRVLATAGLGIRAVLESAVGGAEDTFGFLWTARFNPAILTIAQSLNIVATSSATRAFDCHANLHYTLQAISPEVQKELIQRISLATQP